MKEKEMKSLNNHVCAYSNCKRESLTRLYFPLGFSALFCNQCAYILIKDKLAKEKPEEATHYGNLSTSD